MGNFTYLQREYGDIYLLQYFMSQGRKWKTFILLNSIIPNLGENGHVTFAKKKVMDKTIITCLGSKILSKN